MEWVKLDDAFPDEAIELNVFFQSDHDEEWRVTGAWFDGKMFIDITTGFQFNGKITHWMSLPPAPSKESCKQPVELFTREQMEIDFLNRVIVDSESLMEMVKGHPIMEPALKSRIDHLKTNLSSLTNKQQ